MKYALWTLSVLYSSTAFTADFNQQKSHCLDAANIVKNQNYGAFLQLIPEQIRGKEGAIKRLVDKQNDKYTKSRFAGINNFFIEDFELVEDPESHRSRSVRNSFQKWQTTQVLKVNYKFDTTVVRTNKPQSVRGYCLFAFIDDEWYMTNLLK